MKKLFILLTAVNLIFTACSDKNEIENPPAPVADVVREAAALDALYYGDGYSAGVADNYYIHLSNVGFNEVGSTLPNGWFYRLDLYSEMEDLPTGMDGYAIPVGTYTFGGDSCAPGTFASFSTYFESDEYGGVIDIEPEMPYVPIDGGTIVVSENVIVLDVIINGKSHHVIYKGELLALDRRPAVAPEPDPGIPSDYQADFSNAVSNLYAQGDIYGSGYMAYQLDVMPEDYNGDSFVLHFLSNGKTKGEGIAGVYTMSSTMDAPFKCLKGYADAGVSRGSVFDILESTADGGYTNNYSSFIDEGTVTITENGEGGYTVELDVFDSKGLYITGTAYNAVLRN